MPSVSFWNNACGVEMLACRAPLRGSAHLRVAVPGLTPLGYASAGPSGLPSRRRDTLVRLVDEIHAWLMRNDAFFVAHLQQAGDRLAAFRAVVERAFVHVHAHELACRLTIEIARELHGIF